MRPSLPLVAAFANSFWSAALSIIAVRIYLNRLGIEAYGVIGFFASLQAVLQILDLGLSPAVNRELARAQALGNLDGGRTLVRSMARIYWCFGVVLGGLLALLAAPIAGTWLNTQGIDPADLAQAIMLMGLVLAARWPMSVYQSTLIGLGRLGTASLLNAGTNTAAFAASLLALTYVAPTLQTLYIAQAGASLLAVLVAQHLAWRAMGGRQGARFELGALRAIARFSLGMGGVAMTGIVLTQLDKVLVTRLLPLDRVGEYMLAVTVTSGLALLITPLFGYILPRFSAMVASGRRLDLEALYLNGTRMFAAFFLPVAFAIGLYSHDLIWLWTGKIGIADNVAPVVTLFAIGWAINGLMYFPYCLQLANGRSDIPLFINMALIVVFSPLTFILIQRYGPLGGGIAWAGLQLVYFIVGTAVTHILLRLGSVKAWVLKGIMLPFLISSLFALAAYPLVTLVEPGSFARLMAIAIAGMTAQLGCAASLRLSRSLKLVSANPLKDIATS